MGVLNHFVSKYMGHVQTVSRSMDPLFLFLNAFMLHIALEQLQITGKQTIR
jgi:hypothetical protein